MQKTAVKTEHTYKVQDGYKVVQNGFGQDTIPQYLTLTTHSIWEFYGVNGKENRYETENFIVTVNPDSYESLNRDVLSYGYNQNKVVALIGIKNVGVTLKPWRVLLKNEYGSVLEWADSRQSVDQL